MYESNIQEVQQVSLNFNPTKIRWLTDSKITHTDMFCIGSGEKSKKVSVWKTNNLSEKFEPRLLAEFQNLDGDTTEIKAKNLNEFFLSTSNGSIYYYKYEANEQKLNLVNKWSNLNFPNEISRNENELIINNFDFDSGCDELCCVGDDGCIHFIRLYQSSASSVSRFYYNELCSLSSVLYLKQYEIAVADSLGRVKLWDTRIKDRNVSSMTFSIDGECSPILCLANHPNQQHLIASGNLNGLIFVYDVRNQNKPIIMCHNNPEPIIEVCYDPFSCKNLFSASMDGALWLWNISNQENFSSWDDRNIESKNFLPNNQYTLNSFDVNNDHILGVNDNFSLFKLKNVNFM